MTAQAHYFKLGLFVITGVALVVAGVVVLGAGALFTENVSIETATTDSVDGLDVGAAVKYQGVLIGKVSKIEMAFWRHQSSDPAIQTEIQRYIVIDMQIRRDQLRAKSSEEMETNLKRAIDAGMRMRISSSGLTGPNFMEATFLNSEQYPAQQLPWTPEGLFVPIAPSRMTQIASGVEEIINKLRKADIDKLIIDTHRLINDADAEVVSLRTRDISGRLRAILNNPRVDQTIANIQDTTARLREIMNDPKVKAILNNLNEASAATGPAAVELHRLLLSLDQLLAGQREDLNGIVVSLRRLLENAEALLEDAKSNPSRVLFGEPPPHIKAGGQQ